MISRRDIVEISCKVIGIFCLIWSLSYVGSVPSMTTKSRAMYFMALQLSVYLASAFILLTFSKRVACLLVREDKPVEIKASGDWQKPLYTVCLRVVGAVMLVRAIPSVAREIMRLFLYPLNAAYPLRMRIFINWTPPISAIVSLALAIYLLFGAKAIIMIAMRGSAKK